MKRDWKDKSIIQSINLKRHEFWNEKNKQNKTQEYNNERMEEKINKINK